MSKKPPECTERTKNVIIGYKAGSAIGNYVAIMRTGKPTYTAGCGSRPTSRYCGGPRE